MIILPGISVMFPKGEAEAIEKGRRRLGIDAGLVKETRIIKKSYDCRKSDDLRVVYTIGYSLKEKVAEEKILSSATSDIKKYEEHGDLRLEMGEKKAKPPVVVGFGPAGMFAALVLAYMGYEPIVLERGGDMDARVRAVEEFSSGGAFDEKTNIQFGEGGAGTFSDGKLTTRINDPLCDYVLSRLVDFGAPQDIRIQGKPHIGTDKLRDIVKNIRREIVRLGGRVVFGTKVCDIRLKDGAVAAVSTHEGEYETSAVILAVGHSARDTFSMLKDLGVNMEQKEFSVGVRIEHLQGEVDAALYGKFAGHPDLDPASYSHAMRYDGRGVYTFCMCPGGEVVPANSTSGAIVTNGMSNYRRDGENANSALVVNVGPGDFGTDIFDGIKFQQDLERRAYEYSGSYLAPSQTVGKYMDGKVGGVSSRIHPSYSIGCVPGDFHSLFPSIVNDYLQMGLRAFGRRQRGFDSKDAVLTGPETRTSSPLRIIRNSECESNIEGLYPCGEGAGYAGGIMSAAVDGVRVATKIVGKFAPQKL